MAMEFLLARSRRISLKYLLQTRALLTFRFHLKMSVFIL